MFKTRYKHTSTKITVTKLLFFLKPVDVRGICVTRFQIFSIDKANKYFGNKLSKKKNLIKCIVKIIVKYIVKVLSLSF